MNERHSDTGTSCQEEEQTSTDHKNWRSILNWSAIHINLKSFNFYILFRYHFKSCEVNLLWKYWLKWKIKWDEKQPKFSMVFHFWNHFSDPWWFFHNLSHTLQMQQLKANALLSQRRSPFLKDRQQRRLSLPRRRERASFFSLLDFYR